MNKTLTAREKLTARIAGLNTDQLLAGVLHIGGGYVSEDQRLVRAMLIQEFATREGAEMADELMDQVGL